MKKILLVLSVALLGGFLTASGQQTNPQTSYSTTVSAASPSLWLNFNDLTTAFNDQISQDAFTDTGTQTTTTSTATIVTPGYTAAAEAVAFNSTAMVAGSLTSVSVQFMTAPTSGATLTLCIGTRSGTSITIVGSFKVTVAATTAIQTFYSGTNYSPVSITAGEILGFWIPTGTSVGYNSGSVGVYTLASQATLPSGANTYSYNGVATYSISGTVTTSTSYTSGAVTPRQPGFDATEIDNTSAEFPYNGFNLAPNNTLGSVDWNTPWTIMLHVDRLNWNRSTPLILASKGDISSTSNTFWEVYLQMSGNYSQVCFQANSHSSYGGIEGGICTATTIDAMPNGFNYNIIISNAATGAPGALGAANTFTMYLNGLEVGGAGNNIPGMNLYNANAGTGFGAVSAMVTGGTGYANTTYFTSTGGGSNCVASGTMTSVSGVPTSVTVGSSAYLNYGCTSAPTLVLTSPTGTGAVITAALISPMTFNSATLPLMVPGYVSGGAYYGVGGATSTQTPTYVDEFAIFPGDLTSAHIQSLYYQTKFYQEALFSKPSTPPVVIFDDDGCGDSDGIAALELTIASHRLGYIKLEGVDDSATIGSASLALYRQILDQAGLANVPLSVPSVPLADTNCAAAVANTYNSSTPQSAASYESAATMYRTVLAANPTRKVFILQGGGFRGVYDLMQSPADSISGSTGLQLLAQDATNGGAIYAEGPALEPCCGTGSNYVGANPLRDWVAAQYVLENNGTLPIYWYGGTPTRGGPGILTSRTGKDPFFSYLTAVGNGDDYDTYDTLDTMPFLTSLVSGGVTVAISGSGTGYAAQTPFTSTGGGPNCVVTGIMVSVSGVPSSIIPTGGAYESSTGIGTGCLTASNPPTIVLTAPTGTGAVLTATTAASPCGTMTVTSATAGSTSTSTCTNNYFVPFSSYAIPSSPSAPVMQWFINSLLDPGQGGTPRRQ